MTTEQTTTECATCGSVTTNEPGDPWNTTVVYCGACSANGVPAAEHTETEGTAAAPKIWTSLTAPGERAVKVNGIYVGLIARDPDGGWSWTGGRQVRGATFRQAAEALAEHRRNKWATEHTTTTTTTEETR